MINFLVDSDLHFKDNVIRKAKYDHVQNITDLCQKQTISALICPGDLTNNGWDGSKFLFWKYGGKEDQLTPLKEQYVNPLSKLLQVYLCGGNHDYYVPWPYIVHPVLDYIKEKHGSQRYSFDIDVIHFICLDRCPDKAGIKFLKEDLKKNSDKIIIIFFHYNLTGKWSDYWSEKDKEKFYNIIKYYNVKALIVGHSHISRTSQWKGYLVISAGSKQIALCRYDKEKNELDVEYI